jgi:hypothetical protein
LSRQIELLEPEAEAQREAIESTFLEAARKEVSKGAKPDRVRIGEIPRNFKGDITWRALEAAWKGLASQQTSA